jgi:hypothetical protein
MLRYPEGGAENEGSELLRAGSEALMASEKQRQAARRNVKQAQAGAKRKQTLENMPKQTKTALGKEANKVRKGEAKTRKELNEEASRLEIKGRSKMGKDELRNAIARAR